MADNKTLVFSDENNKTIELATSLSAAERFAEINKKIDEFWDNCISENPNLWDGELMRVAV